MRPPCQLRPPGALPRGFPEDPRNDNLAAPDGSGKQSHGSADRVHFTKYAGRAAASDSAQNVGCGDKLAVTDVLKNQERGAAPQSKLFCWENFEEKRTAASLPSFFIPFVAETAAIVFACNKKHAIRKCSLGAIKTGIRILSILEKSHTFLVRIFAFAKMGTEKRSNAAYGTTFTACRLPQTRSKLVDSENWRAFCAKTGLRAWSLLIS